MTNEAYSWTPMRLRAPFVATLFLFLAGCVTTTESDGGTHYHYALWLPVVILVGGLAFIPIGFLFLKSDRRLAWGCMTVVPLAALLMGSNYLLQGVFVDDKGIENRAGMLGMMKIQKIAFDDVKMIRAGEEEVRGRHSRRQVEVLYLDMKSGESEKFSMSNEVKVEAGKRIVQQATRRGIPVNENVILID